MKLYQRFAEKGYHTSVVTTFGIDFDAYENVVLARLRGAGCRNNLVVTDGRMLTYALDSRSALPVHAGSRYTVRGIGGRGGGGERSSDAGNDLPTDALLPPATSRVQSRSPGCSRGASFLSLRRIGSRLLLAPPPPGPSFVKPWQSTV